MSKTSEHPAHEGKMHGADFEIEPIDLGSLPQLPVIDLTMSSMVTLSIAQPFNGQQLPGDPRLDVTGIPGPSENLEAVKSLLLQGMPRAMVAPMIEAMRAAGMSLEQIEQSTVSNIECDANGEYSFTLEGRDDAPFNLGHMEEGAEIVRVTNWAPQGSSPESIGNLLSQNIPDEHVGGMIKAMLDGGMTLEQIEDAVVDSLTPAENGDFSFTLKGMEDTVFSVAHDAHDMVIVQLAEPLTPLNSAVLGGQVFVGEGGIDMLPIIVVGVHDMMWPDLTSA